MFFAAFAFLHPDGNVNLVLVSSCIFEIFFEGKSAPRSNQQTKTK